MQGTASNEILEWYHGDGDRERRMFCDKNADEQQRFWLTQDWDTGVKVSDIEEWELVVCYGGRKLTRAGYKYELGSKKVDFPWVVTSFRRGKKR